MGSDDYERAAEQSSIFRSFSSGNVDNIFTYRTLSGVRKDVLTGMFILLLRVDFQGRITICSHIHL